MNKVGTEGVHDPLLSSTDGQSWSGDDGERKKPARWGLLAFFVLVNMLTYMDRGLIASDGINGTRKKSHSSHSKDLSPSPEMGGEMHSATGSSIPEPPEANLQSSKDGSGIQGDFDLSNFEDGLIQSVFMIGFIIASLIFAQISKTYRGNPIRLMGIGLLIFVAALVCCSIAPNYAIFMLSRAVVGVGEASFVSLAAPVLDDEAPRELRSVWLAIFYSCISVGYAFGYVFGGFMTQTLNLHWRIAFLTEAALIAAPAMTTTFFPSLIPLKSLGIEEPGLDEKESHLHGRMNHGSVYTAIFRDLSTLLRMPVLVLNVLDNVVYTDNETGYAMYTVTVGVYAYWGPKAVASLFNTDNADFFVGAITALTGCIGTLLGGYVLSKVFKGDGRPGPATLLCAGCTFMSMILALLSFGAFTSPEQDGGHHRGMEPWFYFTFAVGQLFLFAVQGPTNAATIWAVEANHFSDDGSNVAANSEDARGFDDRTSRDEELAALRPLAMAVTTVLIHMLGDVPSPPLAGLIQDHIHNWRTTFLLSTSFLIVPVIIWMIASRMATKHELQNRIRESAAWTQ